MATDNYSQFDEIRPFNPSELPAVYDRLLASEQFRKVLTYLYPGVDMQTIADMMHRCRTNLEFQKALCYPFLEQLLAKASHGCDMDASAIDSGKRYTFVSNHRDIVLDSALLDKMLIDNGFTTTCEIAIGDNLLSLPWVRDLVRVNKSFIVERSLQPRQMLMASKRLSEYMHLVISDKNDNIWIAQREGRAKDSDDRTQPSVLKMMAMGGDRNPIESLKQMHIVPLAISYEYDPCDYLKAREFQLKRDVEGWKKSPQDDVESMRVGIMGFKGRIHYHCAPCVDDWLESIGSTLPKTELFNALAEEIDKRIFSSYRLYANNYVAAHKLGDTDYSDKFTKEEEETFMRYIDGQLTKIDIPDKDEEYLRERLLVMYANPLFNSLKV